METQTATATPPDQLVSATDSAEKIARIRDLLFGPHLREYTQRLTTLSHHLQKLAQETARLAEVVEGQETRFTHLLHQETERLTVQFQEQGKRVQQQVRQLDEQVMEQLREQAQVHTQQLNELAQGVAATEQSLRAEWQELAQTLNQRKLDSPTLADLLIDLGHNLKSAAPTPLALTPDLIEQLDQALA